MTKQEKIKLQKQAYYQKNKEKINAKSLNYYYSNKNIISEKRSKKKKVGKFCKMCEVRLNGMFWGKNNKNYCSECRIDGRSRRWGNNVSNKKYKNRLKMGLIVYSHFLKTL